MARTAPPTRITRAIYDRAWQLYRANPSAVELARQLAISKPTALRLVNRGYPGHGMPALSERLAAETERTRLTVDHPRERARREAADDLKELRAAMRALIAPIRRAVDEARVELDSAGAVYSALRAVAAVARDLAAVEREVYGESADAPPQIVVVRDLSTVTRAAVFEIGAGAREAADSEVSAGDLSRPDVGTPRIVDAAATADSGAPDAGALAVRR